MRLFTRVSFTWLQWNHKMYNVSVSLLFDVLAEVLYLASRRSLRASVLFRPNVYSVFSYGVSEFPEPFVSIKLFFGWMNDYLFVLGACALEPSRGQRVILKVDHFGVGNNFHNSNERDAVSTKIYCLGINYWSARRNSVE